MKPAELLTVALSIPLIVGALAVCPQPGTVTRHAPVASVQAVAQAPALLDEVVVTAKRLDNRR